MWHFANAKVIVVLVTINSRYMSGGPKEVVHAKFLRVGDLLGLFYGLGPLPHAVVHSQRCCYLCHASRTYLRRWWCLHRLLRRCCLSMLLIIRTWYDASRLVLCDDVGVTWWTSTRDRNSRYSINSGLRGYYVVVQKEYGIC